MSRKKDKGRIGGPFVPVLKEMLGCAAWKALEPSSRLLYIALKGRYGIEAKNNGKLYMSVRIAAEEIGINKDTAGRGFQELQHYGFAVMTEGGCLGVDGKGKAPHWRLTELGYLHDPPTKDYLKWDGVLFDAEKNRIPSEPLGQGVRLTRTVVSEPLGQLEPEVSEPFGHITDPACPNESDISRLTTSPSDSFNPILSWLCVRAVYHQEMNKLCDQIANSEAVA